MDALPLPFDSAAITRLKAVTAAGKADELEDQAVEFEAVFLAEMLKPVFETVPTDGPFGGGSAEETWRGMLVENYAKDMAASGGIGLSRSVLSELIALQQGG